MNCSLSLIFRTFPVAPIGSSSTKIISSGFHHFAILSSRKVKLSIKELEKQNKGTSNEIQLTDAIANRIGETDCSGYKFTEERFDCGSKLGFIQANIKLSLESDEMNKELETWLKKEFFDSRS